MEYESNTSTDTCHTQSWFTELREIIQVRTAQPTYTLELENGRNFIANGLLVKTEQVKVLVE